MDKEQQLKEEAARKALEEKKAAEKIASTSTPVVQEPIKR